MQPPMKTVAKTATGTAILRGARQLCPSCGKGHLFHRYLKQVDACSECTEKFSHIRADDGPAWATIVVSGHVVVALALIAETELTPPVWLSSLGFASLGLVLCLYMLPKAKGAFIGAIWSLGATGK